MKRSFLLNVMLIAGLISGTAFGQDSAVSSISEKTRDMKKYSGFLTFYWDEAEGKVWLEIDKLDVEFLYVNSLPAGLGSNDIGLDRGQLGRRRIVKFQRIGPKILLVQPNYDYRAVSQNQEERRAVEEAFAQSVLWGFKLEVQEDARVLVDATDFYIRDVHNVIQRLSNANQGNFRLDDSRSAFYMPSTKNFPYNTEVEVTLTFTADSPGGLVRSVAPTGQSVTLRQRHSFIRLPDDGYEPREFDPRAGLFGINYMDYAAPIESPIQKRFISRHRLKKKNPGAAMSDPVEPIVYYLDRGAPEPIRSALLEGAQWWNQAFEAAGYRNAFRVELLPEDADPMDVRYNVINWVHRSTRGWSYGSSITDPRTGEIIKGHITLGSLRVRQDFLIASGLLAPYKNEESNTSEMKEMALARLKQLSAHEVGHTLGISHNFAASIANRASVMDYPHPLVKLGPDGQIDLSDAYATGIGAWDKVVIKYGYQDFPPGTDAGERLDDILKKAMEEGLQFISDSDARPAGGAHPRAHLWDNGSDAADELARILKIRSVALENFSENNIRPMDPLATLEEVLVPVYLFHRYQLEAAAKMLGGLDYAYALRGDGQKIAEIVSPRDQERALEALISSLQPRLLTLPENILAIIPPRSFGYGRHRELFSSRTRPAFDPLSAAESAANITVSMILNANRAARLIEYHARDSKYPGFIAILDRLFQGTWKSERIKGLQGEVQRVVDSVVLHGMMALAANDDASQQVKSITFAKLDELKNWLIEGIENVNDDPQKAHMQYAISQVERFQKNPETIPMPEPVAPPPGSPIGLACGYAVAGF